MDAKDIETRFTYHAPRPEDIPVYKFFRDQAHIFADKINSMLPDGREKSLAITKLEEVVFWVNAALARKPAKEALFEKEKP